MNKVFLLTPISYIVSESISLTLDFLFAGDLIVSKFLSTITSSG